MDNQIGRFEINLAAWADLRPEDFDGHSEFVRMDAEQRLTWLSEIARFVHDARRWRVNDGSQHSLD
jgi:hypothetical protein